METNVLGELLSYNECDDGNLLDGDGCSASCRVETDYFCLRESEVAAFTGTTGAITTGADPSFATLGLNIVKDKDVCYLIGNKDYI